MTKSLFRSTVAAAALMFGITAAADAATFGIKKGVGGVGDAEIFAPGLFGDVDIKIDFGDGFGPRSYSSFGAGVFNLQISDNPLDLSPVWKTLRTFCIEITQFIKFPDPNLYTDDTVTGAIGSADNRDTQVSRLWEARAADAYSLVSSEFEGFTATTGERAAAFQVALWEIEADGGTDLDSGVFRLDSGGVVRDLAEAYLAIAKSAGTISTNLFALVSSTNQDLLIARDGPGTPGGAVDPVPAPASLLLMGAALAGLGTLRARKKA